MTDVLLDVSHVSKYFGGLQVLIDVSFGLGRGEILGLIGPNGAGKSTLFNCISCFYNADGGRIVFQGQEITRKDPESICRMGIGRTFQIVRIFKDMNVLENIMIGAFLRNPRRKDARAKSEEVAGIFRFTDKLYLKAMSLTISEQKRLEVARVFATGPKIMLLDEMMAGLNIHEIKESVELVLRLSEMGITLVLVEHVMEGIMPIANRVVVLDYGEKIAEGTPDEVINNEKVIAAYFGQKYAKRRENKARIQ